MHQLSASLPTAPSHAHGHHEHHHVTEGDSSQTWGQIKPRLDPYPLVLGLLSAQNLADDTPLTEQRFSELIQRGITDHPPANNTTFFQLLDELATLKLYDAVLSCLDHHPHHRGELDFNEYLFEGATAMVCGQLDRAQRCLQRAHHLSPTETAPVINLAKIFLDQGRWSQAKIWLDAGLAAHPNHESFWSLWIEHLNEQAPDQPTDLQAVRAKVKELHSWQGTSILGKLTINQNLASAGMGADEDPTAQPQYQQIYQTGTRQVMDALEIFYNEGERGLPFLTEYTAVLGAAGEYEKIPPIIWEARHSTTDKLPLRLEQHGIQAALALNQIEVASELTKKLLSDPTLPKDHRNSLALLLDELTSKRQHLSSAEPTSPPLAVSSP